MIGSRATRPYEGNHPISLFHPRAFGSLAFAFMLLVAGCGLYFEDDGPGYYTPPAPEEKPFPDLCSTDGQGGFDVPKFPLELGPTIRAPNPPPAISGGTLAIAPDGTTVVASDPDRDQIYIVSLADFSILATIQLNPGDEPGRIAIDDSGRAHVALRGGGAIVTIDLASQTLLRRCCSQPFECGVSRRRACRRGSHQGRS